MRITFISDTHERHEALDLPGGDVLVHSGDFTNFGEFKAITGFSSWMAAQDYKHKIVIAGNHDISFETHRDAAQYVLSGRRRTLAGPEIIYLENDMITIDGVRFYGSPVTPAFGFGWAFNVPRDTDQIAMYWDKVPECDVLITHGPPLGILDKNYFDESVGCERLLPRVLKLKPQIHAFGHIHEGHGSSTQHGIRFINSAAGAAITTWIDN